MEAETREADIIGKMMYNVIFIYIYIYVEKGRGVIKKTKRRNGNRKTIEGREEIYLNMLLFILTLSMLLIGSLASLCRYCFLLSYK